MKLKISIIAGAVLWLGNAACADLYAEAVNNLIQLEARGPEAVQAKCLEMRGSVSANPFELPPMYTVTDGVAVLSIDGPLIPGNAGFMRLFGVTGYHDIRDAAYEALSQKNVKSILLAINSPGGTAAGAEECNAALRKVGEVKPLYAYTDTVMASAAFWAGAAAGKNIFTANTAILGSVGVIMVHMDRSKQLEKEGIKATVIRAGESKQLNNPYEPLSEKALTHLESLAEDTYKIMSESVASSLGLEVEKFDKTLGRGREFLGFRAVEAGMASAVSTYDEVFALAKNVDTSKLNRQNSRNPTKDGKMKTLATAILLQLAGGVSALKLDFTKAESTLEAVVPTAEEVTVLSAQAVTLEAALKEGREKLVADATTPLTAQVADLQGKLGTVNAELGDLRTTSQALTTQVQTLEADLTASEKVLHSSLGAMSVALQAGTPDATLKSSALVAEHKRVEALFAAKFPKGRISAVAAETAEDKPKAEEGLPLYAQIASKMRAGAKV